MKTSLKLILLLIFTVNPLLSQNNSHKQAIVLEIGGKGLIYSLNYEYEILENINASIGISYLSLQESQTDKSSSLLSFPLGVTYKYPIAGENHYVEGGLGLMNLIISGDLVEYEGNTDYFLNPTLLLGYRYEPINEGWLFKVSFTPFLGTKSLTNSDGTSFQPLGSPFQMWGSLSVGYKL